MALPARSFALPAWHSAWSPVPRRNMPRRPGVRRIPAWKNACCACSACRPCPAGRKVWRTSCEHRRVSWAFPRRPCPMPAGDGRCSAQRPSWFPGTKAGGISSGFFCCGRTGRLPFSASVCPAHPMSRWPAPGAGPRGAWRPGRARSRLPVRLVAPGLPDHAAARRPPGTPSGRPPSLTPSCQGGKENGRLSPNCHQSAID